MACSAARSPGTSRRSRRRAVSMGSEGSGDTRATISSADGRDPRERRLVGAPPARLAILGYGSGQQFVDGIDPAVMIGAALVAVGAVAAFAIERSPQPEHLAVASEVGYVTACACASHEVIVGQAGRAIGQSSSRRGMAAHGSV